MSSSGVIVINTFAEFQNYVLNIPDGYKGCVLDIYSRHCGPCIKFASTYEKLAGEYPQILFMKIDLPYSEDGETFMKLFKVNAFPTFCFFKVGSEDPVGRTVGASEKDIRKLLESL